MAMQARFILQADEDKNVRPAMMPTKAMDATAIIKMASTSMAGNCDDNDVNPSKIWFKTSILLLLII
jgi:hypothetical protein